MNPNNTQPQPQPQSNPSCQTPIEATYILVGGNSQQCSSLAQSIYSSLGRTGNVNGSDGIGGSYSELTRNGTKYALCNLHDYKGEKTFPKQRMCLDPEPTENPDPNADPQTQPDPNADPNARPSPNPNADPQTQPDPNADPNARPSPNPNADPQTQPDPNADPNARPSPNPNADPQTQPDPNADPNARPSPNPNADPQTQPDPNADPNARPSPNPNADPQTQPDPNADPNARPSPNPNADPQTQPDPNADPNAKPNPKDDEEYELNLEFEFPAFCDWAKPVCDFIEWVKKDDNSDDTEIDIPEQTIQPVDTNIKFNGQCPNDIVYDVSFAGKEFTLFNFQWHKFCEFLSYLKYIIIGMAGLGAVKIVGGVNVND